MPVTITYFVHGTTTDNEQHLGTGWLPGELSALGIEQSKKLREQVSDERFDVVFCSDLKRAVDSAKFAFEGTYEIIPDNRLRECNYGDLNGKPENGKKTDHIDVPYPNGESYRDAERRVAEFLAFLKENYDGKHIAIVAHQAPQLSLEVLLNGKTWEQAFVEDWRNTKSWQPGWEYILT